MTHTHMHINTQSKSLENTLKAAQTAMKNARAGADLPPESDNLALDGSSAAGKPNDLAGDDALKNGGKNADSANGKLLVCMYVDMYPCS